MALGSGLLAARLRYWKSIQYSILFILHFMRYCFIHFNLPQLCLAAHLAGLHRPLFDVSYSSYVIYSYLVKLASVAFRAVLSMAASFHMPSFRVANCSSMVIGLLSSCWKLFHLCSQRLCLKSSFSGFRQQVPTWIHKSRQIQPYRLNETTASLVVKSAPQHTLPFSALFGLGAARCTR